MPRCGGSGKIYTRRWQGTGMCCMVVSAYKPELPLQSASAALTNHQPKTRCWCRDLSAKFLMGLNFYGEQLRDMS